MTHLRHLIAQVAPYDVNILFREASGTGKLREHRLGPAEAEPDR